MLDDDLAQKDDGRHDFVWLECGLPVEWNRYSIHRADDGRPLEIRLGRIGRMIQ
jgi:hypothetical protein